MSTTHHRIAPCEQSPVTLDSAIAEYLQAIRARGLAAATLVAYGGDLAKAAAFLASVDVVYVQLLSERAVDQWLVAMDRAGQSPRTRARRLESLRGFVRYAMRQRWLRSDPTDGIKVRYAAKRVTAPEMDELMRMVDAIPRLGNGATPLDVRDAALLRLTLDSALRVHEIAGLDVQGTNTVDLKRMEVHTAGKGGAHGCVPINQKTVRYVRDWLEARPLMAVTHEPALFVSERGRRMCRQTVHAMIRKRGEAVGLSNMHMHLLRHRRIGNTIEALGLLIGQSLARHKSAATTAAVYGAHAEATSRRIIREHADLDAGATP